MVVYSDTAYGVGLNLEGFSFDYAYHTFVGAPSIDNHYVSLSYGLLPKKELKEPIVFDSPSEKHITFEGTVAVSGKVYASSIHLLSINEIPIKFDLRGEFNQKVDVAIGKNGIRVKALTESNQALVDTRLPVLRIIKFPDVASDYWVSIPISLLAMEDIITGYPDGNFKPEGKITRAEICSLLMKTKGLKAEEGGSGFKDVPNRHWAAPYVAMAAELGVVKGYPDGSFRPKANITRAEGLAMVARFAGVSKEAYANQFPDIVSSFWAAPIIAGAHRAGILEYLKGRPFQRKRLLTRAETVEMLYRTQYVKDRLAKDLLNWESY